MTFLTKIELLKRLKQQQKKAEKTSQDAGIPAAVLVPIVDNPNGLEVIFTERTAHLQNHAGQISFPGGRMESSDPNLIATALRETQEEIGLEAEKIEIISELKPVISTTGYYVTPFVGLIKPFYELTLDPLEVASVFVVPLNFLLDQTQHKQKTILYKGVERIIYSIEYENYNIWGMTAAILVELSEVLKK